MLALAALVAAACGAGTTSGESGGQATQPASSPAIGTPAPSSSTAATVEVRITLTEFGIQSSMTNFRVGVPYHFVVTNSGCAAHELMIMQPVNEPATPAPGYPGYPMPMYGGRGPMGGPYGGHGPGAMYCDGSGMPWSAMFPHEIPMAQLDKMALATVEEDDLHPGQTTTLDYTFRKPYRSGTLQFACHLPGHYEFGMRLAITVSM